MEGTCSCGNPIPPNTPWNCCHECLGNSELERACETMEDRRLEEAFFTVIDVVPESPGILVALD